MRLSGERTDSGTKKRRFEKEFPIPSNCDYNAISANFVEGILYVKLPITITPAPKSTQEKLPTPTQDLASDHPQEPKTKGINGQENAAQQGPKSPKDQAIKSNIDSVVDKKISSSGAAEKGADYVTQKALEKDKNKGLVDEEKKRKSTGPTGTVEYSQESHRKLVENAAKRDGRGKTVTAAGGGETGHGKDIGKGGSSLEGLVMAVKKPRRLINLAVGLLVVVVFALYVKDTIFKSLKGESKRAEL